MSSSDSGGSSIASITVSGSDGGSGSIAVTGSDGGGSGVTDSGGSSDSDNSLAHGVDGGGVSGDNGLGGVSLNSGVMDVGGLDDLEQWMYCYEVIKDMMTFTSWTG